MGTKGDRPRTIRLVPGLSEKRVRSELSKATRLTDVGHRALAFYLHEMQSRGLHQSTGHASAVHYAEARLGISRRSARDLVSVGAALRDLPQCDAAFCDGRLDWTRLRMLARIATRETESEWVEKALALSCADLERAIAGLAKGERPRRDKLGVPQVRFTLSAAVDAVTHAEWESAKGRIEAETGAAVSDADLVRHLLRAARADGFSLAETEKRAAAAPRSEIVLHRCPECRATAIRTADGPLPLDALTAEMIACDSVSDETPPWLRRKILARDGFACQNCGRTHDLHVHHIDPRAKAGRTEPSNLLTLCVRCHGMVHEEFLVIAGRAPHALSFADKEGNPVERVAPEAGDGADVRLVRIAARGAQAPPAISEPLTLKELPNPVDPEWLAARGARLVWNAGSGWLELEAERAGAPPEAPPPPPAHRPRTLADVVGQERLVAALRVAIRGARRDGKPLDPVLLTGEPGLGKTALAHALAAELGTTARVVSAPLVADAGPLLVELLRLPAGSVLFLDEIHALPRTAMEALYEAVEDRRLSVVVREGAHLRSLSVDLPPFTLVAATNEPERLPQALASRFTIRERLDDYSEDALAEIVRRTAEREGRRFAPDGARVVARAARGTAREAVILATRVIRAEDGADEAGAEIDEDRAAAALRLMSIDERGLDAGDRKLVGVLRAAKKPIGLTTLAAMTGIRPATILARHEPYLLRLGLVEVTPLGRTAMS